MLNKYFNLPSIDMYLHINAFILIVKYRIGLRIIPLRKVLAEIFKKSWSDLSAQSSRVSPERIALILTRIGRLTFSTCLPIALAGRILMAKNGYKTRLHIGVAKDKKSILEAHAWLSLDGKVVLGILEDIERFQDLPSLQNKGIE